MKHSFRRFWILFLCLFVLIAVQGIVGLLVLRQFRRSVSVYEHLQTAGIQIEQLGLALNDYSKEMKITAQFGGDEGKAFPLPAPDGLKDRAGKLRQSIAALRIAGTERMLTDVATLLTEAASYSAKLTAGAHEEATLQYILRIEPLADRLVQSGFPQAEQAMMDEVVAVGGQTARSGRVALGVLGASLAASLAVGIGLARKIATTLREAQRQEILLERKDSEMRIAQTIQSRVLPENPSVPGFDIAAIMAPAAEVGGDFYDVLPTPDGGAWLGMGDVTGHGLDSGLVMMMAQSMFTVLAQGAQAAASPAVLVTSLNRALYHNLHARLRDDRFMTMVLGRLLEDGRILYAGAHTDLLIHRAASGMVEEIPTEGLWLGVLDDIEDVTRDRELRLAPGDALLFYTDGVTEAKDKEGKMFEVERLKTCFAAVALLPASAITFQIVAAVSEWSPILEDDVSVMVVKRRIDGN